VRFVLTRERRRCIICMGAEENEVMAGEGCVMSRYKISWILYIIGLYIIGLHYRLLYIIGSLLVYIIGSLLVFGSWVNLVPTGLGWFGWLLALLGWAIGSRQKQSYVQRSRTTEIANLNVLRKEGVVTEEEFQKEKERILREP